MLSNHEKQSIVYRDYSGVCTIRMLVSVTSSSHQIANQLYMMSVSGSSVSGASSHLMSLDNLIAPLPPNIMKPQGSKRGRPKLTDEEKNERAAARKKAKQTI
jgi:hypothetical protein